MPYLTFGEQVKIVLSRKGMTIKELAEIIEEQTGKKMSRQNLTQRLGRDNFQEQDMRMIASILNCPFHLSILEDGESIDEEAIIERRNHSTWKPSETGENYEQDIIENLEELSVDEDVMKSEEQNDESEESVPSERGMTVGEFLDKQEAMDESSSDILLKEVLAEMDAIERENQEKKRGQHREEPKEKKSGWMSHLRFRRKEEKSEEQQEERPELKIEEPEEDAYFDEEDEINEVEEEGVIYRDDDENEDVKEEKLDKFDAKELSKEKLKSDREASEQNMAAEEAEIIEEEDEEDAEDLEIGDVNPYTGREYATNSVRMHPKRIGYVQVYDRKEHKWTDMTEWAFLGYQERKKVLLGKDYEPPIYLD